MELLFERALLPEGIAHNVAVSIGSDGNLTHVLADSARAQHTFVPGLAIPGMPNLHSHAFQRGIAGSAEVAASGSNSFWGWREVMYRFVGRIEPEDLATIAAFLYMEMLEAGYTSVAEFHYLHHQPDGSAYADPTTMAEAVRTAARQVGIRQLLLPCLYQRSGFDAPTTLPEQRRFALDTEHFLQLFESLRRADDEQQRTGIALHSLRAVPSQSLQRVLAAIDAHTPVHLHIAEQRREVEECLRVTGQRPIEWLLRQVPLDRRWCLVHATHATRMELQELARSGAVVGLCLTTEGNLGDGRFALDEYAAHGGRFGIGSDSHVSVDPREELRAAEYVVRVWRERRGLLSSASLPHCGSFLYSQAADGGAQALGLGRGALVAGASADLVVLDTEHAQFAGVGADALLDSYVFAPRAGALRDVMVGGRWVLRDARHPLHDGITLAYRQCLSRLSPTL